MDKNSANFVPLTPVSFLRRAVAVYPDKPAVIHGQRSYSYKELHERCCRLASALSRRGIGPGDTVAIMAPNIPAMLEAAVVAKPDEKWGETPCAFVALRDDCEATDKEIIEYCRDNQAGFKTLRTVVFGPLPKTATGKIQKFVLRERAKQQS